MQGGLIQGGKAIVAQPAQVAVKERAQIRNAVFQHRDTVDAHTKGKSLPFVGVYATRCQHLGMHHARTKDFQPIITFADL